MKAGHYLIEWRTKDARGTRDLIDRSLIETTQPVMGATHSLISSRRIACEATCDVVPQPDGSVIFHYGGEHAAANRKAGVFVGDMRVLPASIATATEIEWRDEGTGTFKKLPVSVSYAPLPGEAKPQKATKNPLWTRDQVILALDLYVKHGGRDPGVSHPDVIEMSTLLRQMAAEEGLETYRNPSGVVMKMMNFRSLDPAFTGKGGKGLRGASELDKAVWAEFFGKPQELAVAAEAIRTRTIAGMDQELLDEVQSYSVKEGKVSFGYHRVLERNRKVVALRKTAVLQQYGKLECEACDFDFAATYGVRGHGFIEAHHTNPIHAMKEGDETKPEDLALLCSNCHRMIHKAKPWLSIAELRALLSESKSGGSGTQMLV